MPPALRRRKKAVQPGAPRGKQGVPLRGQQLSAAVQRGHQRIAGGTGLKHIQLPLHLLRVGQWPAVPVQQRSLGQAGQRLVGALHHKDVDAANGTLVKVIIETCLLTDEEKVKACEMSVKAGAHFVKTSTGFSTGGATVEDVRLMRQTVGETVGVKASGGVRTSEDMKAMLEAGANRIGTSGGVALVQGKENTTAY